MRQIRLLKISFDTHISPYQLPAFRGAIAQKVGLDVDLFHNHDQQTGGFLNRYPLIQFKLDTQQGKMRPMLFCLEAGIEATYHLFNQPEYSINIHNQQVQLAVNQLNVLKYTINIWDKPFHYRLHKWQAFNPENYRIYQKMDTEMERLSFLERKLATHILSFGKAMDWGCDDKEMDVQISNMIKTEWLDYKGVKIRAFTLDFKTNVSLPDFVGLGKGASRGLGVIRKQHFDSKKEDEI